MSDFGVVLSASNMGRLKSVNVLNEMNMRMAEAPPTQDQMGQQVPQPQYTFEPQQPQQTLPYPDSSFTSPEAGFTWNGPNPRMTTDVANSTTDTFGVPLVGTTSASSHFQPSYTPGVTSNPSSHSHTSSGNTNITHDSDEAALAGSPPAAKKTFRNVFPSSKAQIDPSEENSRKHNVNFPRPNSVSSDGKSIYGSSSGASIVSGTSLEMSSRPKMMSPSNASNIDSIGSQIPFRISPLAASSDDKRLYGSSSGASTASGVSPQTFSHSKTMNPYRANRIDSHGNKIPFHISPSPETRKRLNNRPKAKRAATQDPPAPSPRPSLAMSKSSSRKISLFGGSKAPRQDYAGFCMGAHLIQLGEDGMKIRNQSVSFTGQNNYWTCSNSMCCFEGPAVPKDVNKKTSFGFDEDIQEAYGVKYRWSFLAKSHTTIGNSKAGYEFQCVFCVGQGAPPFRVKGDRKFIQHVSTHQGQTPNELKMPPFKYIIGRQASDWENFDVNLVAPTATLLETVEQPAELEALEQRLPEMEAPLEIPTQVLRVMTAPNGDGKDTDRSGLGIRMSTGTVSGIVREYGSDRTATMHSLGTERSMQANSDVDWQDDASYHHLLNGSSNRNNIDYSEKEVTRDSALEQSWTTVRDSVYSLHPAPLFARKPSPKSVVNDREQKQQQQQQQQPQQGPQYRHHHQHRHQGYEQARKPVPEASQGKADAYSDTYPYDDSADIVDPELRGSIPVSKPWRASDATFAPERRQYSMLVPEQVLSTPDPSHPGTKWMD